MKILDDILLENKDFCAILNYINLNKTKTPIEPIYVSGVFDSQKSHFIYSLYKNLNLSNTNIIICESEMKAKKYCADLTFFFKSNNIFYYPSKDIIFYSADVKSTEIIKQRFQVIQSLLDNKNITIVLSIEALFDRLVEKDVFSNFILNFELGSEINIEELAKKLVFMGYEKTDSIESEGSGQFSIRGGIIDIFPPNLENPFRMELWDNEVDSIRLLDKISGRSIENIYNVMIYPTRELVYDDEILNSAIKNIIDSFKKDKKVLQKNSKDEELNNLNDYTMDVINNLKNKKSFSGIDKFIQFFYNNSCSILDYIEHDSILFFDEPSRIQQTANIVQAEFLESIKGRLLRSQILTDQKEMIFSYEDVLKSSEKFISINLFNFNNNPHNSNLFFNINAKSSSILKNSLENLTDEIIKYKNLD
ncbi:MAG: hypothetical protein R3Y29_02285 [bacterium]